MSGSDLSESSNYVLVVFDPPGLVQTPQQVY